MLRALRQRSASGGVYTPAILLLVFVVGTSFLGVGFIVPLRALYGREVGATSGEIGLMASAPIVVFGRKDLPATTFPEFIKLMKEKGPDFKVGHSGVGSNAHLTCTLLNTLVGTKPAEIPYRGNGPLMNDLLSGAIDYSCDQVITVAPQVSGGTIKAFVVASPQRSKVLPDTATSEESGLKAYQADAWTALFSPKGLPDDVLAKIHAAYAKAMADPDTIARLEKLGAVAPAPEQRSQVYLKNLVASDVDRWTKVITDAKISIAD